MHPQDLINKFIGLRAQNISIRSIAEQIGVHRNTLLEWQQKYAGEIERLRVVELEAIQERLLPKYEEELSELAEDYKRVTAELRTRPSRYESTSLLAHRQLKLLSRFDKLRAPLRFTFEGEPPEPETPN